MKLESQARILWLAAIALLLGLGTVLPVQANSFDLARYGMIWTQTTIGVATEDFTSADDVFLNGGLDLNNHKVASGSYYVMITTDANGMNRVAYSYPNKPITVPLAGVFTQPYKLLGAGGIFPNFVPQKDTYYFVWIGKNTFTKPPCYAEVDRCRFRIINGGEKTPPLIAYKFWDINGNGIWDAEAPDNEPPIENWSISVFDADNNLVETKLTDVNGEAKFDVVAGDYTVIEEDRTGWEHTTAASFAVTVPQTGDAVVVKFGNRTIQEDHEARTPGFWQGPQGRKLVNADDLQALRDLNLVDVNGNPFNPTTFDQLSQWLNSSPKDLMAFKLSRFLAAMTLNVRHDFVAGSDTVYSGSLSFISIGDLLDDANTALIPPWDVALQTALKDALDAACNNLNFI